LSINVDMHRVQQLLGSEPQSVPGSDVIERSFEELVTPALLLRRDVLARNVKKMAELVGPPTRLRPHAKTHKSPHVAALQIAEGAIGVTSATVWEAVSLARAGIDDVLIANEVVGATKIKELARAAATATITVAVDAETNAKNLSTAVAAEDCELGVLVDVDVGMGRCGVRSPEEAVALATIVAELPSLRFRGVMGFEGHCTFEPDPAQRTRLAGDAIACLLGAADAIAESGLPVEVVSAGGTGTFDSTGADPRVTELQAGSYAFMDTSHAAIVTGFDFALTVLSTVISRHGSTVVLDAGKKTLGVETPAPRLLTLPSVVQYVAEEHTVIEVNNMQALDIGDRVEVVPSYCPITANLHDLYYVVEGGTVVDIWPILARGAGWSSLG
jgi:D-serine deaminase-like pyridoxal phosphate-dependent protein